MNQNEFPPGGWQFYQPETRWKIQNPLQHDFWTASKLIAGHRAANQALKSISSLKQAQDDLVAYTESRLGLNKPAAITPGTNEKPRKKSGCGTCGAW
jgi:hypothetical protein